MKLPKGSNVLVLAVFSALTAATITAQAQTQVFSEDWEVDHSLDGTYRTNYVVSDGSGANIAYPFFDYSTVGIPLAPHSPNGSTHALKLSVNISGTNSTFPIGVSVSPVGFGITDNFDMRFDMWLNFNGPFPGGGSGSTQIGGAGYGTRGTNAQVAGIADSVFIGGSTDGNTASDFRVYSPGHAISYQSGSFRIGSSGTDATILGDPASGFVYAGNNGSRDSDVGGATGYYITNFPTVQCPTNQFLLFPQQTNSNGTLPGAPGFAKAGALSFKWREVSLKKIANTITYSIDNVLIATIDVVDAGTLGGTNILFNMYDINGTANLEATRTNLSFTLIDNVRITNFPKVVSVTSTNAPATAEAASPTPGVFTIFRSDTGVPLTVNYTMTGSASNGVDYATLPGSVTFLPAATQTNIFVVPIDDSEAEITETVTLNVDSSPNYIGGGSANVLIVDNEPAKVAITNVSSQMFERTNDFATFRVTRLGSTNTAFSVNLAFTGGTATYASDFYTNGSITLDAGVQSTNFNIYPISDGVYEGNEVANVSVAAAGGGEYTIGSPSTASITIVDADGPPETVLFSDNFNTDSSANWSLKFASTNDLDADFTAAFAFDYSSQGIPPAPHGSGDTLGLFLTVNKDPNPTAAALNLYPNGQSFSGNYALKFDMFLDMITGGSSTEYALFGINHAGNKTNWWRSGGVPTGWVFDGIFYTVETDGGSTPAYANYSSPTVGGNSPTTLASANIASFTTPFKSPPWAVAGLPTMNVSSNTPVWAEVELSQIGKTLMLRINKNTIFSYSNATPYTAGNIMLGYLDPFDSAGPVQCYVVYDNVRVVSVQGLNITKISDAGANVQIDFTFDLGDSPSGFVLQSASSVTGPYTDATATITQISPGVFRATIAKNGAAQFYRIRHI